MRIPLVQFQIPAGAELVRTPAARVPGVLLLKMLDEILPALSVVVAVAAFVVSIREGQVLLPRRKGCEGAATPPAVLMPDRELEVLVQSMG